MAQVPLSLQMELSKLQEKFDMKGTLIDLETYKKYFQVHKFPKLIVSQQKRITSFETITYCDYNCDQLFFIINLIKSNVSVSGRYAHISYQLSKIYFFK